MKIIVSDSVDEMLEHALISKPIAIEWIEPEEVEHVTGDIGVVTH